MEHLAPPAVVVLAGGQGRRLGGVDKMGLDVGGRSLLDRVLSAVPAAWPVVCVGPERNTSRPVGWVLESPPGGGPAAALRAGVDSAGLDQGGGDAVVVLAGDLPFLTEEALVTLVAATADSMGAVAVDDGGRKQWLLSAWPAGMLRDALRDVTAGASLRSVLDGIRHAALALPNGAAPAWLDCDSPTDLDRARRIHDAGGMG